MNDHALHVLRAIAIFGSQSALARATGISQAAVSKWVRGLDYVSPKSAIRIEAATNGAITREDLRPDIFGPLSVQSGGPHNEPQTGAA